MTCVLMALLLVSIVVIPRWLYPPLTISDLRGVVGAQARIQLQQAQSQLANDTQSSVLQGLAGLLVVVGATATWRQVHISREGQITDRFTRAVEQLGSPNIDIRIGGIYAIERIARNSVADRDAVQFLLAAFVRNHAPWPGETLPADVGNPVPYYDDGRSFLMEVRAPDVQTAMNVLGRRTPSRNEHNLNLARTDLHGLTLEGARLTEANIRHANLSGAVLTKARLGHSDLGGAKLRGTHLQYAHLAGANMAGTDLRDADLSYADLRGAHLTNAHIENTVLAGAQSDANNIWPAQIRNVQRLHELGVIQGVGEDPPKIPTLKE